MPGRNTPATAGHTEAYLLMFLPTVTSMRRSTCNCTAVLTRAQLMLLNGLTSRPVVPGLQLTATVSCRAGPASAGCSGHSAISLTARSAAVVLRLLLSLAVLHSRHGSFRLRHCCVTHEQNVVQHRCLHPTIPALLSPSLRGVCLPLHACALPQAGCYQAE